MRQAAGPGLGAAQRFLKPAALLTSMCLVGLSAGLAPAQAAEASQRSGSGSANATMRAIEEPTVSKTTTLDGDVFVSLLPGHLILDTSQPINGEAEEQARHLLSAALDQALDESASQTSTSDRETERSSASSERLDEDAGPTAPAPTIFGPNEATADTTPPTTEPQADSDSPIASPEIATTSSVTSTTRPADVATASTNDGVTTLSPSTTQTSVTQPELTQPQTSQPQTTEPGSTPPATPQVSTPAASEPEQERDSTGLVAPTASGSIRLCFDGSVPPVVRREALAAANRWDDVLVINGPVVEIDFYWLNFSNPRILGAAGPTRFVLDPSFPEPTARYPIALANELTGIDHSVRAICDQSGQGEIVMVLNANAGNDAGGWAAGDERIGHAPDPEDATDLQTTMLHEFGHGFGFIGSAETTIDDDLAWPNDAESPMVFDLLATECQRELVTGCRRSDSTPVRVGDLESLTGEHLWIETGLGPLLELEAPHRWDSGSSFSHLDELRYTSETGYSLMTPYIETAQRLRSVDSATLAVLQRIGWTLNVPAAPLVSGSVASGPNQFRLTLDPTNLSEGPPPSSFEIRIQRVESNSVGLLQLKLAYTPFTEALPITTVHGIANDVLHRLDLRGVNGVGFGPSVRTGPILAQASHSTISNPDSIVGVLLGTEGPPALTEAFTSSAHSEGLKTALQDLFATAPMTDQVALVRLYLAYLDREPDIDGIQYWLDLLSGGQSLDQVADMILDASERGSHVGLSNGEFVRLLYTQILNRDAEQDGLEFWVERLDNGQSRGSVLVAISESFEHQLVTPTLPGLIIAYVRFEARMPSLDETALWLRNVDEQGFGDVLSALALNATSTASEAGSDPQTLTALKNVGT